MSGKQASDEGAPAPAGVFTRDQVTTAFGAAVAEVERIVGEDGTIALIAKLGAGQPPGNGPFTREAVTGAWNAAADAAKDEYNPSEIETGDTIRSDSIGDLIVNLAGGFLDNPAADTDEVIAAKWHDLHPVSLDGFQVWSRHGNDLGDHCPWSGQQATQENREALMSGLGDDDERCPQGCRGSVLEDPQRGTPAYRAAIVAEVKGWLFMTAANAPQDRRGSVST